MEIKINVFKYAELPEAGKKQALINLADINIEPGWWDFMYQDAKTLGLRIISFDTYSRQITGKFITGAENFAKAGIEYFGQGPIRSLCLNFIADLESLRSNEANTEYFRDEEAEILSSALLKAVLREYLNDLGSNYEHLTSEESVIDTIEANEYLFTEDGKLIPSSWYPKTETV